MPQTLAQLKASSPAYADMSDLEFASRVYRKYYADKMDFPTFAGKVGYAPYAQDNPADGMNGADRFLAGMGKSFVDTGHGVRQLATEAAGLVSDDAAQAAKQLRKDETIRARQDAPLMDTGAGKAGAITGTLAQIVAPGGLARGAGVVGRALMPTTLIGNAAQGTALGAIQPVGENESRTGNALTSGLLGGLGHGIVSLPTWLVGKAAGLSPAISQGMQEAQVAKVIRDFAAEPQRLANVQPTQLVPGSMPTLAEATGDIGLAGLERTLGNLPDFGPQLAARRLQNNAARVNAVRGAFNGADSDAAAVLRANTRATEGPVIAEVKKATGAQGGKVVKWIDRTLASPSFRGNPTVEQALGRIRSLVAEPVGDAERIGAARGIAQDWLSVPRARNDDFRGIQEARRLLWRTEANDLTPAELVKELGRIKPKNLTAQAAIKDMQRALSVSERGRADVASLYNARKHITQNLMPGASGETMIALRGAVDQLDKQIVEVAPTYKQYLKAYADGMRKADQAEVGARLLGGSNAARAADDNPILNANFLRRSGNIDQTVQAATGFRRGKAATMLTGDQQRVVDSVRRDLERQSRAMNDGRAVGSNTVQNAIGGNTLQSAVGPVGAAAIDPVSGVAMLAINHLRKTYGDRTMAVVQDVMLNPEKANAILGRLPSKQREAAMSALRQLPQYTGLAARASIPLAVGQ
jgi:hypothetical protein